MFKWTKRIAIGATLLTIAGFTIFGTDLVSYGTSSVRRIQEAVTDSVPVEFEIRRARDLLEELIPEMHANLKIVAQEEVEVENLEQELARETAAVGDERAKIKGLRDSLSAAHVSYRFGGRDYSRTQVVEELARRFEHLRTAELLVEGKKKLLESRRGTLDAAIQKLEKTRRARIELAAQIEALEGQFRLVQAQSAGSKFSLDNSKLAQTEKLLSSLRKRLHVAQRVLAREARFVETIPVEAVHEDSLVESVDRYLSGEGGKAGTVEF